MKEIFRRTKV